MVTCSCWRLISHFSMRRRSRRPTKRLIEDDGVDQPQEKRANDNQEEQAPAGQSDMVQNTETSNVTSNELILEMSKTLELLQKQQSEIKEQLNVIKSKDLESTKSMSVANATVVQNKDNDSSNLEPIASTSNNKGNPVQKSSKIKNTLQALLDQDDDYNIDEDSDCESEGECAVTFAKPRSVMTGGLQVGQAVHLKLKQKIWNQQYVDFALLLNPYSKPSSYSISLNSEGFSNKPSLEFTSRSKRFLSEFEWNQAWDNYMAIYLAKYPKDLNPMLSYHQNIQKMMAKQANWRDFDNQFRTDREYIRCSWDTIRADLEREAYAVPVKPFRTQQSKFQNKPLANKGFNSNIPKGYCYDFHSQNKFCNREKCSFKHQCPECQGKHAQYQHKYNSQKPATNTNNGSAAK